MSDNKNIAIQDRGWDVMRSILDRELPQSTKKRRFLPWFIFGSAAIALLVMIGISMNQDFKGDKERLESSTDGNDKYTMSTGISELADNDYSIKKTEENIKEKAAVEAKINLTDRNAKKEESKTKVIIKEMKKEAEDLSTVLVDNNKSVDQNLKINNIIKSNILLGKSSQLRPEKNEWTKIEESLENNFEEEDQDLLIPSTERQNLERLNTTLQPSMIRLPLQPVLTLPITFPFLKMQEDDWNQSISKPIVIIKRKNDLSPYLLAVGNYQSNINGLGYGFGVGLDYKMNNFGLYFEAEYVRNQYRSGELAADFAPLGVVEEVSDDVAIPYEGGSFMPQQGDLDLDNFSNITSSIAELKFNLGMRKRIAGKLSFDIGVAYSRLLYATNKSLVINLDIENGISEFSAIKVNSSELYDTGAYSKYDITPHIGFEFEFMPSSFISFHYNYGLKNLIASTNLDRLNSLSEDESIYRRNIEAKIRYQF